MKKTKRVLMAIAAPALCASIGIGVGLCVWGTFIAFSLAFGAELHRAALVVLIACIAAGWIWSSREFHNGEQD